MIFLNTEQQNNPLIISLVIYWNKLQFIDYLLYIRHIEKKNDTPYIEKKAMTPHSSTLAWKIPWTEEPGRLQSMGSRRVRHD